MAKGFDPYAPVSRIPRLLPPPKCTMKQKRSSSAPTRFERLAHDYKEWIQEKQTQKLIAIRHRHQSLSGRERCAPKKVVPVSNVSFYESQNQRQTKPPLPTHEKRNSGRDKSHPLPPVTQGKNNGAVRTGSVSPKPVLPFLKRPKMVRPLRRPNASEVESGTDSDVNGNYKPLGALTPLEKARLHKIRQREKLRMNMESSDDEGGRGIRRNPAIHRMDSHSKRKPKNLSDYQNDENSQVDLCNTYTVPNGFNSVSTSPHIYSAIDKPKITQNSSRQALIRAQKLEMLNKQRGLAGTQDSSSDEEVTVSGSYDMDVSISIDDEVWRKKKELEGLIARQEAELETMQRQNALEREKEKKQADEDRKRRTVQRERLRVLKDAEEQDRLKRTERDRGSNFTPHRPPGDSRNSSRSTSRRTTRTRRDPTPEATPIPRAAPRRRRTSVSALKSPTLPPKQQHRPRTPEVNDNTAFYLQGAQSEEAKSVIKLAECSTCGRTFAEDRLDQHRKVCKLNAKKKPRKTFDPIKMRIAGTDQAKYVDPEKLARHAPAPKPKKNKNNWRAQHDEFINTIRYAKKVSEMEANGDDIATLPPPPPTINPDYVPCPHCNRKFNVTAAERHIPHCQRIKTKPPPSQSRPRRR